MEQNSEECGKCRTLEEEIYWNHFTSIHFLLTLPSNFHDHLKLPVKFSAHMKAQVPDKVSLKSPNGALWDIELSKSDDLIFVGNEWKEFVEANGLKEDCILVFKYERNSGFQVLIFDQGNSCERESSYFVKNCKHAKSNHEDKKHMVLRDAPSTEIIEYNDEEEISFVASKKLRKDDEVEVCSEKKKNTPSLKKCVKSAASKRGGQLRKRKAQSYVPAKKPFRIEENKKARHSSQRNADTPDNGENYLKKDNSHISKALLKKSLNENDVIIPEYAENSPASNESQKLKGQSEKQPSWKVFVNEDGESFRVLDYSHNLETQSEKGPSRIDTSNNPHLITSEIGEYTPLLCYSRRAKGQAEKKANEQGITKTTRPDYRGSFQRNYHSSKSHGKSDGDRPKKRGLPKALKVLASRSASDRKKSYRKDISDRRPVTEVEKENALRRAIQNQTEDSFTAIMRPSCVYTKFFLSIPASWLHKHQLQANQEVVLRVKGKTWHTCYRCYSNNYRGLINGWKKFAVDNSLEEFDVLVFKPVNLKDGAAVLFDVDIFRVV